jgi:hypothetical protein
MSLDDLPQECWDEVAKLSRPCPSNQHPLLSVARRGRDTVLSGLRRVALRGEWGSSQQWLQPAARLLHRACSQAPDGLEVQFDYLKYRDIEDVIQPGVDCGGWQKVHKLTVSWQALTLASGSLQAW